MHHFHTLHFTQASLHKNKNTKVLAQATVAEKTFNREDELDHALMGGPSRSVKEDGGSQKRAKETKSFLFIKLSEDIVSYSNYF